MFSQVKIYNGKGALKKIVPAVELHHRHWKQFNEAVLNGGPIKLAQKAKGSQNKKSFQSVSI